MCGIVGYIGSEEALPILLNGLKRLEYRGYDSAGVTILNSNGLATKKRPGRISELEETLTDGRLEGTVGIAHTRWATHGSPSEVNAHPQLDCGGRVAVVHNGIIENAAGLRRRLETEGHTFRSETDTEVLAHLIEAEFDGALEEAVRKALRKVEGTYGIAVVSDRDPEKIVAARMGSPLLVGVSDGDLFVASDSAAVVEHTKQVIYLDDGELVVLTRKGYRTTDLENTTVRKRVQEISWDIKEIQKEGFPHFMLKEIFEQPRSLQDSMRGRLREEDGTAKLGGVAHMDDALSAMDRVVITACGTSWHAGLIGEYLLEEAIRLPVEVEYASEFRYRDPVVDDKVLVIAISQSGETADTLEAMREAQRKGAAVMGICNVVGSTIARQSDGGIYTHAGPEIGVASTKSFTCQVAVLSLLALALGRERFLSEEQGRRLVQALRALPSQVQAILEQNDEIETLAREYYEASNFLFLGRGYNFPVALEGALKLKEISYIHAEGYPAAEMKHGPIALIDEAMPVVVIAIRDSVYQKVLTNIEEVKARGGRVLAIANEGDREIVSLADHVITIPETLEMLTPILTVIPLQLLAYHIAVLRGCDVDKPRNLAKSVTVE